MGWPLRGASVAEMRLKPGWRKVKFGNVVRQVKDKVDPETSGLERYVAGPHMSTNDLRIRRWGEIGTAYLGPAFQMRFQPGQVLYGSRRTYLRKVAVADFTGICANTTFVMETRDASVLLPEFLPLVMQTEAFHAHSIKQSKGSVNPYINFTDLVWFEFALPSFEDQIRIVKVLKSADEFIETLRSTRFALKKVRASLAVEYFTSSSKHTLIPCSDLIKNDSLTLQTGPFGTVLKASSYRKQGHPIINPVNMKDGVLSTENGPFIGDDDWQRLEKYWMRNGDMIMGRKGDMSNLIFVRPEYDRFLIGSDCIRFRVDPLRVSQRYFFHFFLTNQTPSKPTSTTCSPGRPSAFQPTPFSNPKPPTAAAMQASVGTASPAPTSPARARKCWSNPGYAKR
jgi:restriction endonuclease S subunit